MTADPTPPQSGSPSDASTTLLELLEKGEQDQRAGRTLDAQAVDDLLRAHLAGLRGAR
jgi:microcystin degradation protein MlrC